MATKQFVTPVMGEGVVAREFHLTTYQSFLIAQKLQALEFAANVLDNCFYGTDIEYADQKDGHPIKANKAMILDDLWSLGNLLNKMCPEDLNVDASIFDKD